MVLMGGGTQGQKGGGEDGLNAIQSFYEHKYTKAVQEAVHQGCSLDLKLRLSTAAHESQVVHASAMFPRKPHASIPQAPSSRCILAEHRSSMRKMQRIGREVLTESSFSYASYSIIRMAGCLLTRSLLSDRSFRIYGGHFHLHKLSESTARP
jgi:hypothetical protein